MGDAGGQSRRQRVRGEESHGLALHKVGEFIEGERFGSGIQRERHALFDAIQAMDFPAIKEQRILRVGNRRPRPIVRIIKVVRTLASDGSFRREPLRATSREARAIASKQLDLRSVRSPCAAGGNLGRERQLAAHATLPAKLNPKSFPLKYQPRGKRCVGKGV